jgi:hypothetical protein
MTAGKRVAVRAEEFVPYGARILVRHGRAGLSGPAIANATALPERWPDDAGGYQEGQFFQAELDADLGERNLHDMANGPIMEPGQLYLPAGKLSMDEYRERERRNLNPGEGA